MSFCATCGANFIYKINMPAYLCLHFA
jgi:hypothetical protein